MKVVSMGDYGSTLVRPLLCKGSADKWLSRQNETAHKSPNCKRTAETAGDTDTGVYKLSL